LYREDYCPDVSIALSSLFAYTRASEGRLLFSQPKGTWTQIKSREARMSVSNETLQAIIREYNGFELSAEELELVRPEIDYYLEQLAILDDLDLSDTMSGRLLRMSSGDESSARQQGGE